MPVLDWIGKKAVVNHHREVPYRLIHCDKSKSVGDPEAGNLLVQGDNLEALKALLPYYAGKVKCIYIDPPYNTGNEGWVYNDNVNSPEMQKWLGTVVGKEAEDLSRHDKWLCMMYPRLRLLKEFLREDGSIWISIDDNEVHGFKLILDEIFGRRNFVSNVIWQKKFAPQNDAQHFDQSHESVLVYARKIENTKFNLLPRTYAMNDRYKNPDNDPRGPWTSDNPLRREYREYAFYEITTPSGRRVIPPPGSSWRFNKEEVPELIADNRLWFGKDGKGVPRIKRFLSEVKDGIIPQSIWFHDQVGNTQEAKKEVIALNRDNIFDTPKPERLISRVISIATQINDLVLDSFAGSGTTGAVAHKMGRRHISVEMGDHAHTHIVPRYRKVIDGEQGGISADIGWQGGGGFRYCTLGEPLFDAQGHINPQVGFADLAAHVFFCETGSPIPKRADPAQSLIGCFQNRAIYLLHNKASAGVASQIFGNVLTLDTLDQLVLPDPDFDGSRIVYAEGCTVPDDRLARMGVTFKHIPYQIEGI
jgi:adenine-specific DNA-methyltransferase